MTRVAIIAAMPDELRPLVCGWSHERRNGVNLWHRRFDEGEWVAACAGAGQDAATRAFAEAEKDGAFSSAISIGWAGALGQEYAPGDAYTVSAVIDTRTGERFATARGALQPPLKSTRSGVNSTGLSVTGTGFSPYVQPTSTSAASAHEGIPMQPSNPCLVTSPRVADEAEKRRFAAAYGAGLVDMEAAAIARLAQMRGISFDCIKGVSDGLTDRLPDFNRFLSAQGRFELGRFVFFVLPRPWYWPSLTRMGKNSKRASQSIAKLLLDFLDERGHIRRQYGNPNL